MNSISSVSAGSGRARDPDRRGLFQASGHCAHCNPREGMAIDDYERASTPWRYVSLAHWPSDWQSGCSLPMLVVVANEENHEPDGTDQRGRRTSGTEQGRYGQSLGGSGQCCDGYAEAG